MEKLRGIALLLAAATVTTVALLPCRADEKKDEDQDIFAQDEERSGRRPWHWRIELNKNEIGRILESLKKRDPELAKELQKLREEDSDKFIDELRRQGGETYQEIVREHAERWRQQRRADFLEWLQKNYRRDARELDSLKDRDPDLYEKTFDKLWEKYDPIREAERRGNSELAVLLKEDLRLKERRDYLVAKIKTTKRRDDREKLIAELNDVVANRYDLIVRRKINALERLMKRVEALQKWIKTSKAEIEEARKPAIKAENIEQRMKTLLEGQKGFTWD